MSDERFHGRAFDRTERDFERLGQYLWYPIGRATVERTQPRAGERVLDACCGDGASALPTATLVGSLGSVDAVDLSERLLRHLADSADALAQLDVHRADVTAWEPDDYDLVQCVLGLFFFPDIEAGTRYLVSRARSGGRVGLTIWRRGAVEEAGRSLRRAIRKVTGGGDDEVRPERLIDQINTADAYATWLRSLGLVQVRVTESPLAVPMTSEIAWLVIIGSGFIGYLQGLSDVQVENVRVAYLRELADARISELDATTLIGTGVAA